MNITRNLELSVINENYHADYSSDDQEIYVFNRETRNGIIFSGSIEETEVVIELLSKLLNEIKNTEIITKENE